eukprot:GGOE01057342.1.p1 GENE.GGOE01057342.1~~GGOE01057342.1.p1  ORF type:complete len:301 (+),score=63.23 GGOE01057342.1:37-903(+)
MASVVGAHHLYQNDLCGFSVGSYSAPRLSCLELARVCDDDELLGQPSSATQSLNANDELQTSLQRWAKPSSNHHFQAAAGTPTHGSAATTLGERQASTDVSSDSFCHLSFSTLNLDEEFLQLKDAASSRTVYDFTVLDRFGMPTSMKQFRGKVLLIVNVASYSGLTGQYAGLEALQRMFGADDRFSVLAFPCNQFGGQEPHTAAEVCQFAHTTYGVTFPIMDKVEVNGPNASPLWNFLKHEQPGSLSTGNVKWNFTKFLVDSKGHVKSRYSSTTRPEVITVDIAQLLQ